MATKLNPGPRDCHARALPDEPLFTLLARDPIAPFLVSIWASMRNGDVEAAGVKFRKMLQAVAVPYIDAPEPDAAREALECALAMFDWRPANDGRWREDVAAPTCTGLAGKGALLAVRPNGWAVLERDGEEEERFLYRGVRFSCLGRDPRDPRFFVVHLLGGAADPVGEDVDAVVASISPEGLATLASDLREAAMNLERFSLRGATRRANERVR